MQRAKSALLRGELDSSSVYYRSAADAFQTAGRRDMYFRCLSGLADNFTRRTRFTEADSLTRFLEQAVTAELGSNNKILAEIYGLVGYVKTYQDSCDKAIDYLLRGFGICQEVSPHDEISFASFFYRLGLAYSRRGDPQKALDYFVQAKTIQEGQSGTPSDALANTLIAAAQVYEDTGDPETALHLFKKALTLLDSLNMSSSPSAVFCYHCIAVAEKELGRYDESLAAERKSLLIARQLYGSTHLSVAGVLAQIGDHYAIAGDFDAALHQYDEAHAILVALLGPDHSSTKEVERKQARLLLAQGRVDTAVQLYHRSMDALMRSFGNDNPALAGLHNEVGDALIAKEDTLGALTQFKEALRLSSEKGSVAQAEACLRLGKAWLALGALDTARQMIRRALVLEDSAEQVSADLKSATLQSMGDLLRREGDLPNALAMYRRASNLLSSGNTGAYPATNVDFPSAGYRRQYVRLLVAQAEVLSQMPEADEEQMSRGEDVLAIYDRAGTILTRSREAYKSEVSKLTAQEELQSINGAGLSIAVRLLRRSGNDRFRNMAFSFAERSRGAVLREALLRVRAPKDGVTTDAQYVRENSLRSAAEQLHRRIEWATRYGEPGLLPRLRAELIKTYDAIDALEDTLSRRETNGKNPGLMLRAASSAEICGRLGHGAGLIEYARGSDGLYAFLFTKEKFDVFPLGDASGVDTAAIDVRRGLRTFDGGRFLAASRALYSRLVGPFSAALHGLNHLTIVADGSLGLIPFEALVVTGADLAHAHYLVRDFDVSYALSATMYAEMQTHGGVHDTGQAAFAGFAPVFRSTNAGIAQRNYISRLDPTETRSISVDGKVFNAIPYSGSEVRWIASHFASRGNKSLCELEEKATEGSFKASAEHSKIIHVATHGFMDAKNPDLSALLFSPTPDTITGNDGILYAGEVYDLKLDADLVVLSSCESGVGRSVAGEGCLAMSRAFVYAGARNIAYSLWKVNDRQTRELMRKFYGRVLRGESYVHALSGAKREMLSRRSTANPFSWAGFVLMGE